MIYLILFLLGLCMGSFLNVVIYRETREEPKAKSLSWLPSWVTGRSYCDHCRKKIPLYDNIPLLSYLLLSGKCRFCHKKIPFQYPLVELLTGIEFVWIYFLVQSNLSFFSGFEGFYSLLSLIFWLVLAALLLGIMVADLKYQIIPDTAVFGGIFLCLVKLLIDYRYTGMIDFSKLWAALPAAGFFMFLIFITKAKGMGWGDVKLAILMGLILGFPKIISALMFAFLTGAFIGVILILTRKKKLKSKIAFGPFLIAGTIFALFWDKFLWKLLGF